MDDKWRIISCSNCSGYGVTWNPESWFGVEECDDCGESGRMWIRPKGHTFQYPGGPATGMWDENAYKKGKPIMPYEWHSWSSSDKNTLNRPQATIDKYLDDIRIAVEHEITQREIEKTR